MRRVSARDLHLKTGSILDQVGSGLSFVIERRGAPVAELRPLQVPPSGRKLPDRERRLAKLPAALDSGRILEQDRK
jgi:antitoxin (DNA-binding transcriptional repressor) of toxin-antitoxin stability system